MKSYAIAMLAIMMLSAFSPIALKVPDVKATSLYYCEFSFMEPKIDGVVSAGEWDGSAKIRLGHGFMMFQNDASSLYILLDIIGDTYNDPPLVGYPWGDYLWLSFDCNLDEAITPYVDCLYNTWSGTHTLGRALYIAPGTTTGLSACYSQLGAGFGPSINSAVSHRIWELAISLPELSAVPNGLVRLGVRTYSQNPSFTDDQPENFSYDFSNLIEIALAREHVDLLVLAHEDFLNALKPFKAHKDYTGISTCVQSWQRLDKSFGGQGSDEPERIKRAIAQYEYYCDTKWVMLVGDSDKFPVRYTMTDRGDAKAFNRAFYPTDLYYADLYKADGSFDDWDWNGNGYFGELHGETIAGTLNVDQVDLNPDVAVGRVPASTVGEVTIYVNKVISYEFAAYRSSWFDNALMIATTDWISDACSDKRYIAENYLSGYNIYYLISAGNPCGIVTPTPNSTNINNRLNLGVGFVNYLGHGNEGGWAVPGWYGTGDIAGLTNSGKLPVVFSGGCDTAHYATLPPYFPYTDIYGTHHIGTIACETFTNVPPQPAAIQSVDNPSCFAEDFLVRHNTGAVGYVGCVTGSQPWCRFLDQYFFESLLYIWPQPTLGQMWSHMVRRYYQLQSFPSVVNPPDWYTVAGFHQPWKFDLFGDPSLRLGGVSSIQKEDFLGTYDMDHDGWKGVLELHANPDDPIEMIPNVVGTYTASFGPVHDVYGWVRTWLYPISQEWRPDHQIEFYIDFYDTPTTADDQKFLGYLSTGPRDVIAGTTWWSGTPFEFYALKQGTTSSMLFNSSRASWKVIYPADSTPKPLGCLAACVSDWLASMAISTELDTYTEGLDTDGAYVDQITGRPMGTAGEGIVSFGGPIVNPVVKYAESDSTNLFDRAPIRFLDDEGTFYFQHWNGEGIPGASLPISVINGGQDMFVIETCEDGDGRYITLCYGFGWKGTYAAGKYFQETVYPNPFWFDVRWIIVKWQDTNGDGFVNTQADGDTYTVMAWGY